MRIAFLTSVLVALYAAFASIALPLPDEVHETTSKEWLKDGPKLVKLGVRKVKLTDKAPCGGGHSFNGHEKDAICNDFTWHLQWALFSRLEGFSGYAKQENEYMATKFYPSRADACEALEDAAMRYAREMNKKP